eukprot:scaffold1188_cov167-Chaetoceros_neogracile.AAC.2
MGGGGVYNLATTLNTQCPMDDDDDDSDRSFNTSSTTDRDQLSSPSAFSMYFLYSPEATRTKTSVK